MNTATKNYSYLKINHAFLYLGKGARLLYGSSTGGFGLVDLAQCVLTCYTVFLIYYFD